MTMTDNLAGDLRQHIYQAWYDEARNPGPRAPIWVMNLEWLNEIRKLDDSPGRLYHPGQQISGPIYLLGIPVEVRADGGVPHLEPNHG